MSCRRSINSRHGEEPRETIPQFFANALSKKKPAELTVRFGSKAERLGLNIKRPLTAIWDISGLYTSSRHVPGVSFAGLIHPGLIGCLPDQKLLDTWNKREVDFIATNLTRVQPLANPPFPATAHAGTAKGDVKAKVAAEGARTVPPREHGGNCDIKDLSRGSKIYFPVYVKGGGLSMGDLHFSQGDGEITFCGAI